MKKNKSIRYSLEFGKKEKVLNYTCQTYQLSRPKNVGAVMALIRQCQPKSHAEWEQWYFANAYSETKTPVKITNDALRELGEKLYEKITTIVIPEWRAAFEAITRDDCVSYVYNLTINRTYDGYLREKSVVYDNLAKECPEVRFEESDPQTDHAGDIDFLGWIGTRAFGLQIKPITGKTSFANYSPTQRMKASFADFTEKFGGKVFIIFSVDDEISNMDIIAEIKKEIARLKSLP